MNDLTKMMALSSSGMRAQSTRLRMVSENIANADTPGYRRKLTEFRMELGSGPERVGGVSTGPVRLDQTALPKVHDPSHPMADETGAYLGSNVSLVVEIADAREAQRSYDANLKLFDQARQMATGLLELLRN